MLNMLTKYSKNIDIRNVEEYYIITDTQWGLYVKYIGSDEHEFRKKESITVLKDSKRTN